MACVGARGGLQELSHRLLPERARSSFVCQNAQDSRRTDQRGAHPYRQGTGDTVDSFVQIFARTQLLPLLSDNAPCDQPPAIIVV
jgi:hypothetical protein